MKISVVTACFNAVGFIETTLKSVIDQDYSDLEYIVIDGGSSDGTCEIIERYRHKLAYYVSEPDGGQYEAIQKGLNRATGDVLCWLNADDILMPWTLSVVSEVFSEHTDVQWITGLPSFLNRKGQMTAVYGSVAAYPRAFVVNGWYGQLLGGYLQQESMFWRRNLWVQAGGLELSLRYAADYELWTRFARCADLVPVAVPLAAFRKLPGEQRSSVGSDKYEAEVKKVMTRLKPAPVFWRVLAKGGVVVRSFARLFIYSKQTAIVYDDTSRRWKVISSYRSISRLALRDLILQFVLSGHEK